MFMFLFDRASPLFATWHFLYIDKIFTLPFLDNSEAAIQDPSKFLNSRFKQIRIPKCSAVS